MEARSVVIIGAGVAGLSVGCYAQMNGYRSVIYEMHNIPGGLCTSWKRGDYVFDGCIDWFTGSAPDNMFYPHWQELGVIGRHRFLYHDEYCRYTDGEDTVVFWLDTKRLKDELLRVSPQDAVPINELCQLLDTFRGFAPPVAKPQELMNIWDYIEMMPGMISHGKQYSAFFKYGKISMAEFATRFQSGLLRGMLETIWNKQMPVSLFAATMAWCAARTAGYPEGGSLGPARSIEARYMELGGTVVYKTRVTGINVENGKAVGITLADGSKVAADIVISAADCHATVKEMLGGQYVSEKLSDWFSHSPTFPAYIQVSLGVAMDLGHLPRLACHKLKRPLLIAGKEEPFLTLHNYSFDSTLAPAGKTTLAVRFFTDCAYWQALSADRAAYKAEKDALAQAVIGVLDELIPGIADSVEVVDVATPQTYIRYTGTWKGATMSWLPTTANFSYSLDKTLPGLRNFYLCGQWLCPGGGIPNALKTARDAIQVICRADRKTFMTSTPDVSSST